MLTQFLFQIQLENSKHSRPGIVCQHIDQICLRKQTEVYSAQQIRERRCGMETTQWCLCVARFNFLIEEWMEESFAKIYW